MNNILNDNNIEVSICCIAYNHEKYIRKALDGFVNQKTNFCYEILIHDDASTDNTANIIREFENKYPHLIKPIYQKENQYSKGINVSDLNFSRVKGKYIAICEGDDYWCDENKLQKQYDFMESHPDYSMCCHAASLVDTEGTYVDFGGLSMESGELLADQVIYEAKGWIKTASIFCRFLDFNNMPEFFTKLPVGDYPLRLYMFSKGRIWYDSSIMSAYRVSVGKRANKNSYVYKMSKSKGIRRKEREALNAFLCEYDIYTDKKYSIAISNQIIYNKYLILKDEKNIKELKKNEYYKSLSCKGRLKERVQIVCPSIYNFGKRIKRWKKARK